MPLSWQQHFRLGNVSYDASLQSKVSLVLYAVYTRPYSIS